MDLFVYVLMVIAVLLAAKLFLEKCLCEMFLCIFGKACRCCKRAVIPTSTLPR